MEKVRLGRKGEARMEGVGGGYRCRVIGGRGKGAMGLGKGLEGGLDSQFLDLFEPLFFEAIECVGFVRTPVATERTLSANFTQAKSVVICARQLGEKPKLRAPHISWRKKR